METTYISDPHWLEVAAKVTAKKEELEKTALAESTERSKVLNLSVCSLGLQPVDLVE